MDVSLVICTRNRAKLLAEALPYLTRLKTEAAWEIVFVNNGSSDATGETLAAFTGSSGLDARVLDEPRPGLASARNAGWRRARGRLVAFTDDDCYPAPDYLDQVRACFAEADLGYLGGRVLLFDHDDYPVTIKVSEERENFPPRSFLPAGAVHGANLAVRRDVLERTGGFDERLGIGAQCESAEDIDLVARASALGFHGAYDPRPVVFHHHRRRRPEELRRLLAHYDIGRGAFYAKAVMQRGTRGPYLLPVFRRIAGNIRRRDFAVMFREFRGAWRYIRD